MAHIKGISKKQYLLLPPSVEDFIPENHPARVIDMFVSSLDLKSLGIIENNEFTGRPSYPPDVMLKILLYGYLNKERSSRILEKRTYEDLAYIWLAENLHPDYRTIARFRQNNIGVLKSLLKETLKLYQAIGVEFDGIAFSDGTKVYANASDNRIASFERIKKLEEIAENILKEAEKIDSEEDKEMRDENKYLIQKEKLADIKKEIERAKQALSESKKEKVSLTDKDAKFMKHPQGHGIHLSYNCQLSVDKNGIILEADVVDKPAEDGELLKERVKSIEENTGKEVKGISADSGYFETNAVKQLIKEGKVCIIPRSVDYKRKRGKFYDIKDFEYDKGKDIYICPNGKELKFKREIKNRGKEYLIYGAKKESCMNCVLKDRCYKGKTKGREIMIYKDREFIEIYEEMLKENEEILKERKKRVEYVIGIIKSGFNFRRFMLRGLEKVKVEWKLMAAVYNLMKIRKMMIEKGIKIC